MHPFSSLANSLTCVILANRVIFHDGKSILAWFPIMLLVHARVTTSHPTGGLSVCSLRIGLGCLSDTE